MRFIFLLLILYVIVNAYAVATGSSSSQYCSKRQTNLEFYLLPGRSLACGASAAGTFRLSEWLNAPHEK
jgi:hypothetical protein